MKAGARWCANVHLAKAQVAQGLDILHQFAGLGVDQACPEQHSSPVTRETDAAGAAHKQIHAQLLLEPLNTLGQCRLRNMQLLGRLVQTAGLHDRQKALQA